MANQWEYDYTNLYTKPAPQTQAAPEPQAAAPEAKPHKKRGAARVIAFVLLVVFCFGAGMGGGYFGTVLAQKNAPAAPDAGSQYAATPTLVEPGEALTSAQIAAVTSPSVVEVVTEQATHNQYFGQYVLSGAGSGVIISEDGYIITNQHVVKNADQVKVTLADKNTYAATIVGADAKTDIAVLKIDASGLPAATIGDSDSLVIGEFVMAVGNPLGTLGGTVTSGLVSALNRDIMLNGEMMNLLQHSAPISPGNSGGGLFNARGELVGIVNSKAASTDVEGIAFAVPIDTAMSIAAQLMKNGFVAGRPVLGVNVITISDAETAQASGVKDFGVYIQSVNPGGPAEAAGLLPGDRILSIDKKIVNQNTDVTSYLDKCKVGDVVTLTVVRNQEMQAFEVTLAEKNTVQQVPQNDASQQPQQNERQGSVEDFFRQFFGDKVG